MHVPFEASSPPLCRVLPAPLAFCQGSALSLAQIRQTGVLRLATSADFAPFNSQVGGKPSGFEVDLSELLSKALGLKVT